MVQVLPMEPQTAAATADPNAIPVPAEITIWLTHQHIAVGRGFKDPSGAAVSPVHGGIAVVQEQCAASGGEPNGSDNRGVDLMLIEMKMR